MAERPSAVLFVCNFNTVRSPMAAAIARRLYGREIHFGSAGIRRGEPDPFAAAVLAEIGLDLAGHQPQLLDEIDDMNYDLVVSLAAEAHHGALELTRHYPVEVEYWPTPDPTAAIGSRERIMEAYRELREGLSRRIAGRLGPASASDAGHSSAVPDVEKK